jgi:hypothetical protein
LGSKTRKRDDRSDGAGRDSVPLGSQEPSGSGAASIETANVTPRRRPWIVILVFVVQALLIWALYENAQRDAAPLVLVADDVIARRGDSLVVRAQLLEDAPPLIAHAVTDLDLRVSVGQAKDAVADPRTLTPLASPSEVSIIGGGDVGELIATTNLELDFEPGAHPARISAGAADGRSVDANFRVFVAAGSPRLVIVLLSGLRSRASTTTGYLPAEGSGDVRSALERIGESFSIVYLDDGPRPAPDAALRLIEAANWPRAPIAFSRVPVPQVRVLRRCLSAWIEGARSRGATIAAVVTSDARVGVALMGTSVNVVQIVPGAVPRQVAENVAQIDSWSALPARLIDSAK